jgi:hypothetical protein
MAKRDDKKKVAVQPEDKSGRKTSEDQAKKIGGPFLTAAILCSSISEESDGVVSVSRIVDEIRLMLGPGAPDGYPSKANPIDASLWALIIIRRGDAPARKHELKLVMEQPNGITSEIGKEAFDMPAYPNGAVNLRVRLALKMFSAGVFWIDVLLDEKRLTRMALNLQIHRAEEVKPKQE